MRFLDRDEEERRLDDLLDGPEGRLAVVYGRRRVGKTRLLLEWCRRHGGLYTVADRSTARVQRRYLALAVDAVLPGFADVEYGDWGALFDRLGRDAKTAGFSGPLVIDELPYLVDAAPELASVLQRFVDHEGKRAGLKLAIAGSSQRTMQSLVLSASAPLYGRAHVLFEVTPLPVSELRHAFATRRVIELVTLHTAWGGVPRYWELAADVGGNVEGQVDALVLDPLGPLHDEPDRLLLEELPPEVELRPILDAIGQGAHRVSEVAGRVGWKATSLSRPIGRLQELGLVRREVPFGASERKTKRSLYRIADPFVRMWFRVVAPHRALLATRNRRARLSLLRTHLPALTSLAWEDLCRTLLPELDGRIRLARDGPWLPGQRWWQGSAPEWDLVSASSDGRRLLLGEVKWSSRPFDRPTLTRLAREVASRPAPPFAAALPEDAVRRALFIPEATRGVQRTIAGVHVVLGRHVLR